MDALAPRLIEYLLKKKYLLSRLACVGEPLPCCTPFTTGFSGISWLTTSAAWASVSEVGLALATARPSGEWPPGGDKKSPWWWLLSSIMSASSSWINSSWLV